MSYRQTSYDPTEMETLGRPLRPYNWVQWTGVMLQFAALLAYGYYFAMRGGWVRDPGFQPMLFGLPLLIIGMTLTYSRRTTGTPVDALQRQRNRRSLIITLALCAALLGVAALIEFQGA